LSYSDYHSSPATIFLFTKIDGGNLIESKSDIEELYQEILEEVVRGNDFKFDFNSIVSNEIKAFEIMVNLKLKKTNYVLFELIDSISDSTFICIDMDYAPKVDLTEQMIKDFNWCFSNFENYDLILQNASFINPSINDYAIFVKDTLGKW
jgi:hypothetical protein